MDVRVDTGEDSVAPAKPTGPEASERTLRVVISIDESSARLLAAALSAFAGRGGAALEAGSADVPRESSAAVSREGDTRADGGSSAPLPIPAERPPAVDPKDSVLPDALICLEDGRRLTMLKRYLRSRFGLTPEQYRARWNLPLDYPMVAPRYAMRRSDIARRSGLGRTGRRKRDAAEPVAAETTEAAN